MNFTEFRLKVRRFFRTYRRLILIILIIWAMIFFINLIFKNKPVEYVPTTTYEAHSSVMDQSEDTPKSLRQPIEDIIEEYIGYCNDGNYQRAFDMLSEDCKKYEFNDSISEFMTHVLTKMPTPKTYSIQSYSSTEYDGRNMYIYEIKYTEDLMATGLTNTTYSFTSENMIFYNEDGELKMSVGNFMYHTDIKSISENEYLKIDVVDKIVNYSKETYEVKFTNRTDYTIVIADDQETEEVALVLPNELRTRAEIADIVLKPKETITLGFTFPKFVDDGDASLSLLFSSIRVMETYSGTSEDIPKEVIQSEIDNAISKFSMEVDVDK